MNLLKLGHAMLKGFNADLVRADLVCLHVKLSDANVFLPVTCAVCDNLNSPMVLSTDVIDRLCTQLSSDQMNEMNDVCNDDTDLNKNADGEINLNEWW